MIHTRLKFALAALALCAAPAFAQTTDIDAFKDAPDEAKLHTASGFVCPLYIGHFERDAFGERDPEVGSDFCAYSARDGVYGTVVLTPIKGAYDPAASLADDFAEQEGTGGKKVDEKVLPLGGKTSVAVFTRTYETAALETLHYRILFSGHAFGTWALEATVEFATPRDDQEEVDFLNAVYGQAVAHMAGSAAIPPPTAGSIAPKKR